MPQAQWQVDDNISGLLSQLQQTGEDSQTLSEAVGDAWWEATLNRFDAGTAPDGKPWPVSSRARIQGGQTLVDKGLLRDSLTMQASPDEVRLGSNIIYARIHQLGGTIKPVRASSLRFRIAGGGFVSTQEVKIPARPYVGFGHEDAALIKDALSAHLGGLA